MDEEAIKKIETTRSEEVTHIIEKMPSKFGTAVTLIVVSIIGLLLTFGFIVRYPESLQGQITISAKSYPVKLVANTSGNILLLYKAGESVRPNDFVAIIKNPANTQDVLLLDSMLKKVHLEKVALSRKRLFPENLSVGELNVRYFAFIHALYQYQDYYFELPYSVQKEILVKELATQKKIHDFNEEEYNRLKNKNATQASLYSRDSVMQNQKIIAVAELEKSNLARLAEEQEFKRINGIIVNNEYDIDNASNKLKQINNDKIEKEREVSVTLFSSYSDLQESIREWERKYVLISPIAGKVDYLNFLHSSEFVEGGKELITIVPSEDDIIGQVYLPEQGAGKLKKGQKVIVKLDDYPYKQFGSVIGTVANMSLVSNEQAIQNTQNKVSTYLVTVSFSNGLKTNYQSILSFHYEAKGIAEIITDDRRLIERLFDNLKYGISKK